MPRQPSRTPTTSCPRDHDRRATARMTAFRPGQSPPPVSTPIRIDLSLRSVAAVSLRYPARCARAPRRARDRCRRLCRRRRRGRRPPARRAVAARRARRAPAFAGLHVLDARRAARPLRADARGTLQLAGRGRRQRARAARRAARCSPAARASPACRSLGAHPEDPRRRAARLSGRRLRPARHRRRRARLPRAAGRDGQLRSLAADGGRRPRVRRGSSAHGGSSSARTTSSPTWSRCGARSASTAGRSTASRTARTSASGTRSRIPIACSGSCSTRSSRTSARPTSASSSSARRRASSAPSAATACVADLAAVVRTRHNGAQLLDALTLLSIVDPTYRTSFDVPRLLQRAHAAASCIGLNSFLATAHRWNETPAADARPGPARERALCATGGTRGARPRRRSPDARRSSARAVAKLPAARLCAVRPRDGRRHRVRAAVPAVGADAGDTARPAQADRADAARERRPRPVDAARVGAPGARADDAAASSSSCPAPGTRRSRARSATSRGTRSRASCSGRFLD